MSIGIMQGSLQDFDLVSVLQVVGVGRQYTGVRVELEDGTRGTVFMKSGKVVSAEAAGASGMEALSRLIGFNRGSFSVFRQPTPTQLPQPIGALRGLLTDLQERAKQAAQAPAPQAKTNVANPPPPPPSSRRPTQLKIEPVRSESGARAIVAVASPKGGCGKSTIALNLALGLARRGTRVMLVDSDMNSDVLSALDARTKAKVGALDVVVRGARLDSAVLETALTNLTIVPAMGSELVDLDLLEQDHRAAWKKLLGEAATRADVVLVDTPAGMGGTTRQVLSGCTHVLGVLQAESIAQRSFERFHQSLQQLSAGNVKVLGVVLNMLQMRHPGSFSVFQEACREQLGRWLFDTTIPRHASFLDAAMEGLPLRPLDEQAPGAVGFLFDNLASEVAERLALPAPKRAQRSLLL